MFADHQLRASCGRGDMLATNRDQVDLWIAPSDDIYDRTLLTRYLALLTPEERQRQLSFAFAADQRRYLVTRALVRVVLSRYADIAPEAWAFTIDAYGRPWIANREARAQALSFNLSHTNSLIVLAVARQSAIGVDVENYRVPGLPAEIAESCFSAEEAAELRAMPEARQQRRFFEYWTLKESYVKARGQGLSIPLDSFTFHFQGDNRLTLTTGAQAPGSPASWWLWQFCVAERYLIAGCLERRASLTPRLLATSLIPLQLEEPFRLSELRTSEVFG